jgi:hypothetical protein
MIAYKLFRKLKNGDIKSLFINKKHALPISTWLDAEDCPTKGYAHRPGWHCTQKPEAPHLSTKNRIWLKVEIEDYIEINRPEAQGGLWYLAQKMKILSNEAQ